MTTNNQVVESTKVSAANGQPNEMEMLKAKLAALEAENKRLEAKVATKQTISFKVTEKGGVSLYGVGRFPVTLYLSQWIAVIAAVPALKQYLEAHKAELSVKE